MHNQHSRFSLSFAQAELWAFLLQLISGNKLLQKFVPNENDKHPLAEKAGVLLGTQIRLVWVRHQKKETFRQPVPLPKGTSSINPATELAQLSDP